MIESEYLKTDEDGRTQWIPHYDATRAGEPPEAFVNRALRVWLSLTDSRSYGAPTYVMRSPVRDDLAVFGDDSEVFQMVDLRRRRVIECDEDSALDDSLAYQFPDASWSSLDVAEIAAAITDGEDNDGPSVEAKVLDNIDAVCGQLLRLAFDRNPEEALLLAEALIDGNGRIGVSIVPHAPVEVTLMFVDDQGGQREILHLKAEPRPVDRDGIEEPNVH